MTLDNSIVIIPLQEYEKLKKSGTVERKRIHDAFLKTLDEVSTDRYIWNQIRFQDKPIGVGVFNRDVADKIWEHFERLL